MIKFGYITLATIIGMLFGIMFMGLQYSESKIIEIKRYNTEVNFIGFCMMEENTYLDGYLSADRKAIPKYNIRSQDSENIIVLFAESKMTAIRISNAAWKLPQFGCLFS